MERDRGLRVSKPGIVWWMWGRWLSYQRDLTFDIDGDDGGSVPDVENANDSPLSDIGIVDNERSTSRLESSQRPSRVHVVHRPLKNVQIIL